MSKYKCNNCGCEFIEKKMNCPECGEKQYYCNYYGCDKQLIDGTHKYCAVHGGAHHEGIVQLGIGLLIGFIFLPLLVFVWLVSMGKINPIEWFKNSNGK